MANPYLARHCAGFPFLQPRRGVKGTDIPDGSAALPEEILPSSNILSAAINNRIGFISSHPDPQFFVGKLLLVELHKIRIRG